MRTSPLAQSWITTGTSPRLVEADLHGRRSLGSGLGSRHDRSRRSRARAGRGGRRRPHDRLGRQQRHPPIADRAVEAVEATAPARRGCDPAAGGLRHPRRDHVTRTRACRPRRATCATSPSSTALSRSPASRRSRGRPRASSTPTASPWPLDPRGALEAQLAAAAAAGLEVTAGFEIEFFVGLDEDEPVPAHRGPAYSPHALLQVDELVTDLLRDLDSNGLTIGQLHAEYGLAQVELSLAATDPMNAADDQMLARQTIHAAARSNGLRASFAPLITLGGRRAGLAPAHVRGARRAQPAERTPPPSGEGASWIAGLLRELPAITAVTTPERAVADPAAAGLLRRRVRVLGRREPRGGPALRAGRAAARGGRREHRAEGVRRLGEPVPRARRRHRVRPGGHRRRPPAARPDRRGPGRLVGARRAQRRASGRSRRTSRRRRRRCWRPARSRARSGPSASARSSPPGAATPPGPPTRTLDEIVAAHLWRY